LSNPKGTTENLQCLLRYLGITIRYNVIRKEVEFDVPCSYVSDNQLNAASAWITSKCVEFGLPTDHITKYLMERAARNPYNPVMEWIQSEEWDGCAYIDALIDTIECPPDFPDNLKATLITKWLISGVGAASMTGGLLSRGVLVLQGEQAIGKTSWLRNLCPKGSNWFGEAMILDPADSDSLRQFVSHWIIELGELEGTLRKADIARLKGFITRDRDLLRIPYAEKMSVYPRRSILCASVNQQEVLVDMTGNSRWWVIPCRKIDYKHDINMQQVWAEAYARLKDNETWWLTPEEEKSLNEQNKAFEMNDPIEELLSSKLYWADSKTFWESRTATSILVECGIQNPTRGQATSASLYLRKMGAEPAGHMSGTGARLLKAPRKNGA
jgi:putative DNA primase/helicase